MNKRVARAGILAILAVLMVSTQCWATEGDYTYKVRLYSGNYGTFSDGSTEKVITVTDGGDGAYVSWNSEGFKVNNDEYTLIGFREAGHDDASSEVRTSFAEKVKSDKNYVAVYRAKENLVSYTVRYLDAAGNSLMSDATYYGDAGDKVRVSFKYIEGYAPTAYNLSKTLSEDPADNVLAFRYYPSSITVDDQDDEDTENATNDGNATDNNANNNANNAGSRAAAAQASAIDNATPGTPEVVDLDDSDVPLAAPDGTDSQGNADESNTPGLGAAGIAGIGILAALIAAIVIALIKRRKSAETEEDEIE